MNFSQTNQYILDSNNDSLWLFNNKSDENEPLQEPAPFEDFKFSFGTTPDFSITDSGEFSSFISDPIALVDPFLQEPFSFAPLPNTANMNTNTVVLDESDQKAFSNFLDTFFMDSSSTFQQPIATATLCQDFYEEHRKTSILQSLDEQKKIHLIASIPKVSSSTANDLVATNMTSISSSGQESTTTKKKRDCCSSLITESAAAVTKKTKIATNNSGNRGLLTEDEKRVNHIASEQKRRSTIRDGFKDLTELVPKLKNINNSKSAVLFKAVEFIKHLEQRNKSLKDKVGSLELRAKVQGRVIQQQQQQQQQKEQQIMLLSPVKENKKSSFINKSPPHSFKSLPANARNALLAHKSQQKQLLLLQEQLQMHQRLLAQQQHRQQHQQQVKNKLPPILGRNNSTPLLLKELASVAP